MEFFDCNCSWGMALQPPLRPAMTTDDVLAEMDRCGLHRALVRNSAVFEQSPEVGNPQTCEEVAGCDRPRLASWAASPVCCRPWPIAACAPCGPTPPSTGTC